MAKKNSVDTGNEVLQEARLMPIKDGKIKPCLRCDHPDYDSKSEEDQYGMCPCGLFSGEQRKVHDVLVAFKCDYRKMHKAPPERKKD